MAEDDPRRRRADGVGRVDERVLLDDEDGAANHTGCARGNHQSNDEDDVREALAEHGDDGKRQDDPGNGHHGVHSPLQNAVDRALEVTGGEADDGA